MYATWRWWWRRRGMQKNGWWWRKFLCTHMYKLHAHNCSIFRIFSHKKCEFFSSSSPTQTCWILFHVNGSFLMLSTFSFFNPFLWQHFCRRSSKKWLIFLVGQQKSILIYLFPLYTAECAVKKLTFLIFMPFHSLLFSISPNVKHYFWFSSFI